MSEDFRARARAWLEANAPRRASADEEAEAETRGQDAVIAEQKAFQAKLFDAGFAGITWPKEYGGQGLTSAEQIAWSQESREYDLPTGVFFIGLSMPGNTILRGGLGGAEGSVPAEDAARRRDLVPAVLRARSRRRTWPACRPARSGTAMSGC